MKPKPRFRVTGAEILTGLGSGHFAYPPLPTLPPGRPRPQLEGGLSRNHQVLQSCWIGLSVRGMGFGVSVAGWLAAV